MPIPNLIHGVTLEIEQKDTTATKYDTNAGEPVRQVARKTTITIMGQVSWDIHDELIPQAGGIVENEDGYILLRKVDMAKQGITIQNGDKIVRIGSETGLELFITKARFRAGYPKDGPTLVRYYFEDRAPTHSAS